MLDKRWKAAGIALLGVCYGAVHIALLYYDAHAPHAFLEGDRGPTRFANIVRLIDRLDDPWPTVMAQADPGDYVVHALLYLWAGQYGVIVAQVVLGFFVVVSTYLLAGWLHFGQGLSFVCGLVVILMPGSMWQPHVLVSEGIYNPLLAVASLLIVAFLRNRRRFALYCAGLLLVGCALLIRAQLAVLPLAWLLFASCHQCLRRPSVLLPIIPLSYVPLAVGAAVLVINTGSASLAPSDHGLAANLLLRAERMARVDHVELGPLPASGGLTLGQFRTFAKRHPTAYAKTLASDAVNLVVNPGWTVVLTRYFGLVDQLRSGDYWTRIRDEKGLLGAAVEMASLNAGFTTLAALSLLAWLTCLAAVVGAVSVFARREPAAARRFLLLVLVVALVVPLAAGAVRWQHRTPVDFILALLVVAGLARAGRAAGGRLGKNGSGLQLTPHDGLKQSRDKRSAERKPKRRISDASDHLSPFAPKE